MTSVLGNLENFCFYFIQYFTLLTVQYITLYNVADITLHYVTSCYTSILRHTLFNLYLTYTTRYNLIMKRVTT